MTHAPTALGRSTRASQHFDALVRDVTSCTRCERMAHTHALTAANGPLDARVLFVAEAVGRRGGAITGVPLTRDESARRFEDFLALAGVAHREVFVTNAVLCHPIGAGGRNRPPTPAEVVSCNTFLERTLDGVAAPLIVALGRTALEALRAISPHEATLVSHAATPMAWRGRTLVCMYHPSRQSTLHRPHAQQESDWRRLGQIILDIGD